MLKEKLIRNKIFRLKRNKKEYRVLEVENDKVYFQDMIDNGIVRLDTVNWFLNNFEEVGEGEAEKK